MRLVQFNITLKLIKCQQKMLIVRVINYMVDNLSVFIFGGKLSQQTTYYTFLNFSSSCPSFFSEASDLDLHCDEPILNQYTFFQLQLLILKILRRGMKYMFVFKKIFLLIYLFVFAKPQPFDALELFALIQGPLNLFYRCFQHFQPVNINYYYYYNMKLIYFLGRRSRRKSKIIRYVMKLVIKIF